MMAVMARKPIDLDQLLNEGVAHTIRIFISRMVSYRWACNQ